MEDITKAKIIVVEDSEFSRAFILSAFKKLGIENIDAPDGAAEAWEMIAQAQLDDTPYDLVCTDLNMPEFDGVELITRIKEDTMSASQKIIVITADADPGIKFIVKELGVLAYFNKPFKPSSFEKVVLAILNDDPVPEVEDLI